MSDDLNLLMNNLKDNILTVKLWNMVYDAYHDIVFIHNFGKYIHNCLRWMLQQNNVCAYDKRYELFFEFFFSK